MVGEGTEDFSKKSTAPTVKHDGESIVLRGYLAVSGTGNLVWVQEITKKEDNVI